MQSQNKKIQATITAVGMYVPDEIINISNQLLIQAMNG